MRRQTRLCVTVAVDDCDERQLASLVQAGVDAFVVRPRRDDWLWLTGMISDVRDIERHFGRPLAIILELPEIDTVQNPMADSIGSAELPDVDFLAISTTRGSDGLQRLRRSLDTAARRVQVLARFDHEENFGDIEGFVGAADAVMITEEGLRTLGESTSPVIQKSIARQCLVAAKPCLVARKTSIGAASDDASFAGVFDLANLVFDHVDGFVFDRSVSGSPPSADLVTRADAVLKASEGYLELFDRPVRVGFGQPPNTAALAYSIRHILKMQEIAAVAVYSITGATARVISKNWIQCPILAFSPRPETARIMCLYHGVTSRHVDAKLDATGLLDTAGGLAKELGIAGAGDRIIVVSGHPDQTQDHANGFVVETLS
jgi:pyruvate kinase